MAKKISLLFPTYVYRESLAGASRLNTDIEHAIATLIEKDKKGRKWSANSYANGYTSYPANQHLHQKMAAFRRLTQSIMPHIYHFVRHLNWDINPRKIVPLSCWANAMGKGTQHGLHNHQLSMISGVYYVNAPRGAAPFVIEDPRMDHFMHTPPRKSSAPIRDQIRVELRPKAGELILFESWMRHEVPLHNADEPRLSVAFNFGIPTR
jgi:uncharacterized protein (TIGR02466 family)